MHHSAVHVTPKLRQRYEIVRIFVKQQSISEVAKKKGVDRKTVRKWITRFQEQGITGLADRPRTGRHSSIDEGLRQKIMETLAAPSRKAMASRLGKLKRWPTTWACPTIRFCATSKRKALSSGLMPEAPRRTQPSSATKRRTRRGALCRAQPLTQRPPQLRPSRAPSAGAR